MASPDELLAMLEEAAEEAEHAHNIESQSLDCTDDPLYKLDDVIEELAQEIVDEVSLGLCFEIHRACKMGFLMIDEPHEPESKHVSPRSKSPKAKFKKKGEFEIIREKGKDIFGNSSMKKSLECICPHCSRSLAAARFAPHLEKCMGMGRNSSRIASRRIAKVGCKKDSDNESEDEENDKDGEWQATGEKKAKRARRDRSTASPKRTKKTKSNSVEKNGDIPSVESSGSSDSRSSLSVIETMTMEERKNFLLNTCCVVSEHTKKLCTRTHRCPQHTDEQRQAIRAYLLGLSSKENSYEDTEFQADPDSLHWDVTSNPSPSDSNSTSTGSGPTHRKQVSKSNKKASMKIVSSSDGSSNNSIEYS